MMWKKNSVKDQQCAIIVHMWVIAVFVKLWMGQ